MAYSTAGDDKKFADYWKENFAFDLPHRDKPELFKPIPPPDPIEVVDEEATEKARQAERERLQAEEDKRVKQGEIQRQREEMRRKLEEEQEEEK